MDKKDYFDIERDVLDRAPKALFYFIMAPMGIGKTYSTATYIMNLIDQGKKFGYVRKNNLGITTTASQLFAKHEGAPIFKKARKDSPAGFYQQISDGDGDSEERVGYALPVSTAIQLKSGYESTIDFFLYDEFLSGYVKNEWANLTRLFHAYSKNPNSSKLVALANYDVAGQIPLFDEFGFRETNLVKDKVYYAQQGMIAIISISKISTMLEDNSPFARLIKGTSYEGAALGVPNNPLHRFVNPSMPKTDPSYFRLGEKLIGLSISKYGVYFWLARNSAIQVPNLLRNGAGFRADYYDKIRTIITNGLAKNLIAFENHLAGEILLENFKIKL